MNISDYTVNNIWIEKHRSGYDKTHTFSIPRPQSAIALITLGCGSFNECGRVGKLKVGDIFFVPFGSVYESHWLGDPASEYISCHFGLPLFQNPQRRYHVASIGEKSGLAAEFVSILEAYRSNETSRVMRSFYLILDEILSALEYEECISVDPRITEAMRYLSDNCTTQIYMPELARMIGMSETHFYSKFRECANMTPIEYKNRAAISLAKEMLTYNLTMPIEEVSEAAGFASSIYFRRVFRAVTGMSPKEYRRSERGEL